MPAAQGERPVRPDPDRGRADARRRRRRVRRGGGPARPPPRRTRRAPLPRTCSRPSPRDRPADPRGPRGARRHRRPSARRWPACWSTRRSPRATWASPSPRWRPGAVATALSLWGTDEQQQTYLPAFTGDEVPAAALALAEPTALFDPLAPATTATRTGDGFVLDGVKSGVVRGAEAELFVVGRRAGRHAAAVPRRVGHAAASPSSPTRRWACAPPSLSRLVLHGRRGRGDRPARRRRRPTARCVRNSRLALVCARGRHRPGRARLRDAVRQGAARRSASRSRTVSRWPSWSPTSRSSCRACGW